MILDPERVTELHLAPFQGAEFYAHVSGGLRFAATPRLLSNNPSGCEPGGFNMLVPFERFQFQGLPRATGLKPRCEWEGSR